MTNRERALYAIQACINKIAAGEYLERWYVIGRIEQAFELSAITAEENIQFRADLDEAGRIGRQINRDERDHKFMKEVAA